MKETQQMHQCRCETCPEYSERAHPCIEDAIVRFCGDNRTQLETKAITARVGCLSHPKAREYLNGDVIGELERMKDDQSRWATEAHFVGARTAYKRALALLRGDGK